MTPVRKLIRLRGFYDHKRNMCSLILFNIISDERAISQMRSGPLLYYGIFRLSFY